MSTMMNLFGSGSMPQQLPQNPTMPMNPMQQMQMVMSAMRNPWAFIKQKFPDIPDQYQNDPNAIMQYLQQTRGNGGQPGPKY